MSMSRYTVEPYSAQKRPEWDAFVRSSRNGTFLLCRDYMDYHADRFTDCSLMARDERGRLAGLLPASLHNGGAQVRSHGGLTYGAWVLPGQGGPDASSMLDLWQAMARHYRARGASTLIYKPVPHIYHRSPSEDDLYTLFRVGAICQSRLASSALSLRHVPPMSHSAADNLRRARRAGLVYGPSDDWAGFWQILAERLAERFDSAPVHSLEEISRLRQAFPEHINLYTASSAAGEMLAGTVIYDTGRVVHTQYICSTEAARHTGALAGLFDWLIAREARRGVADYFDLGTSNESDPRLLNEGLLAQKASYGARTIAYDTYLADL